MAPIRGILWAATGRQSSPTDIAAASFAVWRTQRLACVCLVAAIPVSYTHLDVYKRQVQAVFDVSDYSGKATVDANYAELWAALESEFRVLSEQGCEYTNCKFSDGIIILLK